MKLLVLEKSPVFVLIIPFYLTWQNQQHDLEVEIGTDYQPKSHKVKSFILSLFNIT